MKRVTYFAVFEPSQNGAWGVYFPDLPGCTSMGSSFDEAMKSAEEALGLHLWAMEEDGEAIPSTSCPPYAEVPEGNVVAAITVFPDLVKNEMDNRAIRTNVSIPAWLKASAEAVGLNYSQVLQQALKERLGIR